MGLHPDLTGEQMQRIMREGQGEGAPQAEGEGAPQAPKKRKYNVNLKAEAWKHFIRGVTKEDGSYTATCKYCGIVYDMGNQKGTGSLRHHYLKSCQKKPTRKNADKKQQLLQFQNATEAGDNKVAVWSFDQATCRKYLAIMVIVHEYPFNIVSHYFFRLFLKTLQPQFKLISRNTLRSDCISLYEQERKSLYEELGKHDCKVSFSTDLWTNHLGDRGFMALTCHYIDDSWRIRKRIINFCPLPTPHTGKNIAEAFYGMLVMWNLDKRAFSLVLDNASSNDACIRELLGGPMRDALPVDGSVFHQRCGCHILNLVVQDGISVLTDEITKVRETMKYLRHSQARMERFKLASSQVKVPNKKPAWDVPTRWNSTYLMLELALELRPAIERYATLDKHYTLKPKDTEWEAVEALMDCLKIFYTATLKFSAVKYPTLNYFFPEMCEVYVSIKNMESSPYPFIVLMATKMFAKWERYWTSGNTLLAIACVLDPRCKVAVVEYYFKLVYPGHHDFYMSNLNACINAMFMEYLEAYNSSLQSQTESSSRTQSQSQRCQSSGASSSGAVNNIRAGLKSLLAEKKTTEPVKSELEQYISEPLDDTALEAEFDILAWWKLKVPKYPVLSRLARDILAVPASTVASESTFSTSGRTLSVVRNSLNDESIEALICAQDWLRAKVTENGEQVGDPLWPSVEATPDDTIAGSQA
ncbi:Zinc finger BED domain-containing protein DAYSLEEPER [Rhynchospora pubera]|uniref:Zinc finger BED domain-containing protein DAYSLEEPER n=1 Tax=Rhynchospora pubera TaxID=906938 RepID=A0AAV8HVB5_9POAL|nr:Zinc finger BED domain-containing protein DAYSLEEPER [Rhynchospora pubera]